MTIEVNRLDHVNVTVPPDREEAAKHFYENVLRLKRIEKPAGTRQSLGAWYELDSCQIHLSVEEKSQGLSESHIGLEVADVDAAAQQFHNYGVEIIPDKRPVAGRTRFYVRDPGGNLIEITRGRPTTDDR